VAKVKVATTWLDCCAGCHMSFLDLDEAIVDVAGVVEFTATPITDFKEFAQVDVGIIEGAISNEHDEEVARDLRNHCQILMVWGDCACFGGICSMRNLFSTEEIMDRYYHTESTVGDIIPSSEELPRLTKVRSVGEVVKVDCFVPGCPPSPQAIHYALGELLEGRIPIIPAEIMRFD
jgi:NAD-reducing hydrogenase small subunit